MPKLEKAHTRWEYCYVELEKSGDPPGYAVHRLTTDGFDEDYYVEEEGLELNELEGQVLAMIGEEGWEIYSVCYRASGEALRYDCKRQVL